MSDDAVMDRLMTVNREKFELEDEVKRLRAECDSRRAQNIADAELIRETDARIAAARDHLDVLINGLPPVANYEATAIARRALAALTGAQPNTGKGTTTP